MELEVGHGKTEVYPRVRLIKDRGVSYAQASQELGVHPSQLRDWVKKFADDPQHAFPGHGQMKPEQLEIARLKREVTKLKAERDILKNARRSLSSCGHRNVLRCIIGVEGSGRWLFGGINPVKKHGPWAVADLRVVTRSSDPG